MNPIISVEDLYTLARDQPIGIPILADVVYFLKRAPGMSGKELAKRLEVRRSYLSHAIELLTGLPLGKFISEWRLLQSQDLLLNTDLPYIEVAQRCGKRIGSIQEIRHLILVDFERAL